MLVEVAAPGVFLAVGVPLGAAVGEAVLAEPGEGGGIALALGEEVAAVAEHVGPPVEAELRGGGVLAQFPANGDEPLAMSAAAKGGDGLGAVDGPVGEAGGANGLGGVFGDVVRHGLG